MESKTWQSDPDFCDWLVAKQYAQLTEGKLEHSFTASSGLLIYMWEAWQAGRDHEATENAQDAAGADI